ncbi:MAG: Peroxisome chaperone and import receptor [Cirrosporium novae-zelandiae]|nr:MAG: Peroxisome chaperone and import receptor [Cirrosporium novae-zelandiae]KAI9737732.1 MAG: Peroxisome chaperone and import receptor [Cirrosporium novae-zelandiae]
MEQPQEKKEKEVAVRQPDAQNDQHTTTAATAKPVVNMPSEEAPDPEEEDLDELDDMLDEFSATQIPPAPVSASPTNNGPGRPPNTTLSSNPPEGASGPSATAFPDEMTDEEFAKQLEEDMAKVFGGIEKSPEMQKELEALGEALLKDAEAAAVDPLQESNADDTTKKKAGTSTSTTTETTTTYETFQDKIRSTMERMQQSSNEATAAATADSNDNEADIISKLLKEMENGDMEGLGSEEDFSKILLGMMEQLTNRELLYDPMKEFDDKFPGWMAENKDKISKEDRARYEDQQGLVKAIVQRFERDGYSDKNVEDREFIIERMQKMQKAGSPPADLVGNMDVTQDAIADLESGCSQQ